MDCMEGMKEFPDKYFELAIVDPPYGINVNMNMGKKKGEKGRYLKKGWDSSIPDLNYFNDLFRVSKNQIIWGGNYMTYFLPASMGWICWDKAVPDGFSSSDFELAWTSFEIAAKKCFIPYSGFIGIDTKRIHPTEKPVKLYKWILQNYANPGDKILDTHGGSFSSVIACLEMGFEYIAFEIDKDYYYNGLKRINDYLSQPKMFVPEIIKKEQSKLF